MSDLEFDVLDELYFVTSYDTLIDESGLKDEVLVAILKSLYQKGWIKILATVDDEVDPEVLNLDRHYSSYYYLASKLGLLEHNKV